MPRTCVRCVMDTSDAEIVFDEAGVCNHCRRYDAVVAERVTKALPLDDVMADVRRSGRGKPYDCIIGLSGGVDSSYVALLAHRAGLRALAVHLDNGWDSELAVSNIHNIVSRLEFELDTHVVEWPEFKDLQLAFLRASVVDIEMITDHAITALAYQVAIRDHVPFILSGTNFATEAIMPASWIHRKSDLTNLRAIQRRFGTMPIRTLPTASSFRLAYWRLRGRVRSVSPLDHIAYDKQAAIKSLQAELDWRPYGGKHYESLFTRFYQSFILPAKFGIDKRRAHLSTLICSQQMTREEALIELATSPSAPDVIAEDRVFVLKKLGLTESEFDDIMRAPPRSHLEYPSDQRWVRPLLALRRASRR